MFLLITVLVYFNIANWWLDFEQQTFKYFELIRLLCGLKLKTTSSMSRYLRMIYRIFLKTYQCFGNSDPSIQTYFIHVSFIVPLIYKAMSE